MNRSRMPEIMKTGLIARATVPLDAGKRTQTAESLCHHCIVQRRAVLLAEQQILAVSRTPSVMLRDAARTSAVCLRGSRNVCGRSPPAPLPEGASARLQSRCRGVKEGVQRLLSKLGMGDAFNRRRVTAYRKKPARTPCCLAMVSALMPSRLINRVIVSGRISRNGILPTERLNVDRTVAPWSKRMPRLRLCRM